MEQNRKRRYTNKIKKQKIEERLQKVNAVLVLENKDEERINLTEENLRVSDTSSNSDKTDSDNSISSAEINNENLNDISSSEEEFNYEGADAVEIKELQEWVVTSNTPHMHVDKLLKILRKRVLKSLPSCTKTLLKCEVTLGNVEKMKVSDGSEGEFKYFGIKNQLINLVDPKLHENDVLELIINIDGMSPFKSSPVTVWPILGKVYTKLDLYEPFTIAIYSGSGKPKSCMEYLQQFILEVSHLLQDGIILEKRKFEMKLKFFVCDCPARSFLKNIVSHVSFNGCERCKVKGKKVDGVTVFLEQDAERRTDEGFRNFIDPDCHTGASPLCNIKPPINMINGFVLDPMHLLYLGCMKRILDFLLSPSSHKVRLSAKMKSELVRRTSLINNDIPEEFPRKMRSTVYYVKYKAVEFKFFTLYAAPIVFKKLLSEELYNHLMLFTVACRLISSKNKTSHITEARAYLTQFVKQSTALFGSTFVTLNIHNLVHVPDDVEYTDCSLSEISAFAFESYLGTISAVIRSPNHIIAQYAQRLQEREKFLSHEIHIPPEFEVLLQKKNQIYKVKYKGLTLSRKHPNNTVLLKGGFVADIHNFLLIDSVQYIEIRKYMKKEIVFKYPCESDSLNIWEVSKLSNESVQVPLQCINQKLIKMRINFSVEDGKRLFVVPLLH